MSAHFLFSEPPSAPSDALAVGMALPGRRSGAADASLGARERAIINGLAAYQLRYAKPEEALALLQLSNRLWPDDRQTLRLLCDGLLAIGDAAAAEVAQNAYRRLSAATPPSLMDRMREALIHAGRARFQEARAVLEEMFRFARGEKR